MKLHKRTLKWAAALMREYAAQARRMSRRDGWDSNTLASPTECLARAFGFDSIAERIESSMGTSESSGRWLKNECWPGCFVGHKHSGACCFHGQGNETPKKGLSQVTKDLP